MEEPDVSFFVVEVGSELAGFYAIERVSGLEFELTALFVEPNRIGTGVGRALIEYAKSEVRERSGSVLLIQGDPHAKHFYRHQVDFITWPGTATAFPFRLRHHYKAETAGSVRAIYLNGNAIVWLIRAHGYMDVNCCTYLRA